MTRVYYFVNGILNIPGASKNWTGKAVTGLNRRFSEQPTKTEKVEYYTGPITRMFWNKARAERLLKVNRFGYSVDGHWERVVVGHSNGADVILDAMRLRPFKIKTLLLISPAVPSDCSEDGNGLNTLLKQGWIENFQLWIGKKDLPLRLGKTGIGRMLGYGALGLDGPRNLDVQPAGRVEPEFGHSTWFDDANIEDTLDRFAVL